MVARAPEDALVMSDTIFLEGLEVRGIIGLEAWEREKPQTIRIDLEMACDAAAAATNDDIAETINYRAVAKAIFRYVEENQPLLLETLAHRLAEMIRREHGVRWIRLRASKPGAIRFSENVGVEVVRGDR